jgi:hypothetical protein
MDRNFLPQDQISGNVTIIEPEHAVIHDGTHFTLTRSKTLDSVGSVNTVMFTTPSAGTNIYFHFICAVEADKKVNWSLYQNASASAGSTLTAYNNNLNSEITNPATIVGNPTITTNGTVLETHIVGSASTPQSKTGGGANARNEWVLAASTSYLVAVTATEATTESIITMPFYYRYGFGV